jgi:hypothetical protein
VWSVFSRSLGTSTELDIFKGVCEILIIGNKCLNVGLLELEIVVAKITRGLIKKNLSQ